MHFLISKLRGVAAKRGLSRMIALSLSFLVTAPFCVRADDQDIIDYREHVMKTMGEQAAAIGMILEQRAPATNFATHVRILAITASTAKKAFEPQVVGGQAKPAIWTQWADFAKRLDTLAAVTRALAEAAKSGDLAAVGAKIESELACKSCHETYRLERK